MKDLFKELTKEGTAKVLQDFVELSKKHFPSFITTILKEIFEIACNESNYENMDYLFSLLGANEPILKSILFNTFITDPHSPNSLKLLKYLEDKGVDLKNNLSTDFIFTLLSRTLYYPQLNSFQNLSEIFNEQNAQFELFKYLLNNFIVDLNDLNRLRNNHGEFIMTYALKSRNLKLIKYFISMEMGDIKKKFNNGKNAFFFTLKNNWQNNIWIDNDNKEQEKTIFKIVKYLVEKGVNIHECENGVNVLHLSAQFHSLKMIKYFISLAVDLHSLDHQNNNALLLAFKHSLDKKENETTDEYSARYSELKKKNIKIIKYLISEGINVEQINDEGMDAFLYSIKWGNFELIKFIADLIPSLKTQQTFKQGFTTIYDSLKSFNIEIFKYLDQFPFFADYFDGKNVIKSKNYVLFELIEWYIHRSDIKFCKDFKKFLEVFDFFLNKRNNINCINSFGYIPLQRFFFFLHGTILFYCSKVQKIFIGNYLII